MSKLFTDQFANESDSVEEAATGIDTLDPTEELEDSVDSLSMALEASKTALQRVDALSGIEAMLKRKKLATEAYFTSLECYKLLTPVTAKASAAGVPAMEDFKNPFSSQAAHVIALESISSLIEKTWKTIKEFFQRFFKKAIMLVKRMLGMELDLVSYEKGTEALIYKLKKYNATNTQLSEVPSKLPSLLANPGMDTVDSDFILTHGLTKIDRLKGVMTRVGFNRGSVLLSSDSILDELDKLVRLTYSNTSAGKELWEQSATAIKEQAFLIMSKLFTERNLTADDLPEKAFISLLDNYDHAQIKGVSIMAMAESRHTSSSLPGGANIYLAHQEQTNYYVSGCLNPNTDISGMLKPIGKLSNLDNLYSYYKSNIKSFSLKGTDASMTGLDKKVAGLIDFITKNSSVATESDMSYDDFTASIQSEEIPADTTSTETGSSEADDFRPIKAELTKFLATFLMRLQTLFAAILTNFYNTFETLRFEVLKYIYNSAVQFKY